MSNENVMKPADEKPQPQLRSKHGFLVGLLIGGLLGSILVGSVSLYSHVSRAAGLWTHSALGWGPYRYGASTPEEASERIEFATDWMLKRINADETQRQRVKSVVEGAVKDLFPMKEQHQQNREAMLKALAQPTVDREALKETQQAEVQLLDTVSSRLVQAIADVADVLTPEQRAQLIEHFSRFHR
jgi:periplasmic protein CpxP/Spy